MTPLIVAATPFLLNSIMGIAKYIGAQDMSKPGKRLLLAIFAIVGVMATNSLVGTPIDAPSLGGLLTIILESFVAFVAAHGSYLLFWKRV